VARALAWVIDLLAREKLPDFPFKPATFFQFPGWLLAGGAVVGALFALVGAVAGVRQAARLDPAKALLDP
jgi:ABC-type antimicrobial peptide transport system permease subunit